MKIPGLKLFGAVRDAIGDLPADDVAPQVHNYLAERISNALNSGTSLHDAINGNDLLKASPELAATFTATYRSVALISGAMGQLPAYLEDKDGYRVEDPERISERALAPAARILFGPEMISGLMYFPDLIMQITTDLALFGNAFLIKKTGTRGRLIDLEYSPADNVSGQINRDSSGQLFASYDLTLLGESKASKPVTHSARQLIHPRLPRVGKVSSATGFLGTSPLVAASRALNIAGCADTFVKEYFIRGGFGNQAIITFDKMLNPEQAKDAENRLHSKVKSGGILRRMYTLIGGGAKVTPLTTDTQSAEMAKLKFEVVEEIARAYGIPGSLIGIKTTEVGTGLEELTKIFIRFCLTLYRRPIERAITYGLFQNKYKFKFDVSAFSAADLKALSAFISATQGDAQRHPVMKRDEIRSMIDVPKQRGEYNETVIQQDENETEPEGDDKPGSTDPDTE